MSDEKHKETLNGEGPASRVPLTGRVARLAIMKCFQEKDQWHRKDLVATVEDRHFKAGGFRGTQPTVQVVKKVLRDLREEGIVRSVSQGIWRYVDDSNLPTTGSDPDEVVPDNLSEEDDEETGRIQIKEEIGKGDESVYLYYNPNDLRLAQIEERSTWECKVGYTASAVDVRILGQGARTAMCHFPVVGLRIRTDDARALESVLHRSLRMADSAIIDASPEWFMTSPNRVKAWHDLYMASVEALVPGIPGDILQHHENVSAETET